MKNPSSRSDELSPFSSSTHDPGLTSQPAINQPAAQSTPKSSASNVPASVQKIMAANARGDSGGGGIPVIATSYKPSGKVGPNALPVMLLATLLGTLITAAVYYFTSPHFNFVLVTQMYVGALLGAALWFGVKAGKVRSQKYASLFAVVGTILVFGLYHGANVWREREDILDYYAPAIAKTTKTSLPATRARLAQKLTYGRATQLYWKERFNNGVTLRESSSSSRSQTSVASTTGTHFAGWGYVAFLLAEIGMTALMAAIVASVATTARFSETGNNWYSKKRLFSTGSKETGPVWRLLHEGNWSEARRVATERKWKVADVAQVYASTAPGEDGGWIEMTITQDKQQKLVFERQVDADALRALGAKV